MNKNELIVAIIALIVLGWIVTTLIISNQFKDPIAARIQAINWSISGNDKKIELINKMIENNTKN